MQEWKLLGGQAVFGFQGMATGMSLRESGWEDDQRRLGVLIALAHSCGPGYASASCTAAELASVSPDARRYDS